VLAYALNPEVEMDSPLLTGEKTPEGYFEVKMKTETSKLNINELLNIKNRPVLERLFTSWGIKDQAQGKLIDRLMDWVDKDDLRLLNGAEKDDYERQGMQARPRNGYFQSVEEIRLVIGAEELLNEAHPGWEDAFTVFGSGEIDINRASGDVLTAYLNINQYQVEALIEQRESLRKQNPESKGFENLDQVRQILGMSPEQFKVFEGALILDSSIYDIESTGYTGDVRRVIRVVVNRAGTPGEYYLWQEK